MKDVNTKVICFGEMLWDILPSGKQAGGGSLNVAVHLRNLGLSPFLVSKVGTDDLGQELLDFVRSNNLNVAYIQQGKAHLTGVAKANVNDVNEVIYRVVQPVAWDYLQFNKDLENLVHSSDFFIYGSVIARQEPSRSTLYHLLSLAQFKIFDVNLRPPFYTPESIGNLMSHANVLKMNHNELIEISNWFANLNTYQDRMKFLRDRFEIEKICVSLGEKGACMLVGEEFFEQSAFKIQVVDTIGSGDAFLATLISQMIQQKDYSESLKYACAAGALVATHKGATPEIDQEKIEAFIKAS